MIKLLSKTYVVQAILVVAFNSVLVSDEPREESFITVFNLSEKADASRPAEVLGTNQVVKIISIFADSSGLDDWVDYDFLVIPCPEQAGANYLVSATSAVVVDFSYDGFVNVANATVQSIDDTNSKLALKKFKAIQTKLYKRKSHKTKEVEKIAKSKKG